MNLVRPLGIRLGLVGCCLLPGAVAAAVDVRGWLPQWWPASVLLAVGLHAWVRARARAGRKGQDDTGYEKPWWTGWLDIAMFVAMFALAVSMYSTARLIALDVWDSPTQVRVLVEDMNVSERRGGGFDEQFCYQLARLDGSKVPVELCRDVRAFSLDERITVLLEPTGLVGPETPQQVAGLGGWRYLAPGLAVFLVAGGWLLGPHLGRDETARTRAPTITRRVSIRSPRPPARGRRPGAGRKR
ncbi:hypothetical protein OHA21_14030 [Actinoplanes sp. NBC_00393]|uniref:hypothetical protein n=1 Tax=Actinoplanes sp. NBC_00393 TaxID=2975953 RepID=UPI002E21FA05